MHTKAPMDNGSPEPGAEVVIIGGALAGGAAAILLLNQTPDLRVTIVEKSEVFSKKVGEATVEVSSYFLCRILGLTSYLNHHHLVKQGMRFWFYNQETEDLGACAELGGRYLARVASFQVDRSLLDQEVLDRAVALGAKLLRPATVQKVELSPGGHQTVTVKVQGESTTLRPRWVIDASGVACVLARANGWWRANEEHPTSSAWARWRGVKDWDGRELALKYPEFSKRCCGMRFTATNHFMGDGWWAWCIPLRCGEMSVGVVLDQRMVDWPTEGRLEDRLKAFLSQHPAAREMLQNAECIPGDVHWRKNLPYYSTTLAGDGFCLVGDAAGFIDPFYSPGLDWMGFTVAMAAQLIQAQKAGEDAAAKAQRHSDLLAECYQKWFTALYKDKYAYFGDYELMTIAFHMDVGLYYLGPAPQPFMRGLVSYTEPMFTPTRSRPFHWFMATYNRRLAAIGRSRRERHCFGRANSRSTTMLEGYSFSRKTSLSVLTGMRAWLLLELREGWRTWFSAPAKNHKPLRQAIEKVSEAPV